MSGAIINQVNKLIGESLFMYRVIKISTTDEIMLEKWKYAGIEYLQLIDPIKLVTNYRIKLGNFTLDRFVRKDIVAL